MPGRIRTLFRGVWNLIVYPISPVLDPSPMNEDVSRELFEAQENQPEPPQDNHPPPYHETTPQANAQGHSPQNIQAIDLEHLDNVSPENVSDASSESFYEIFPENPEQEAGPQGGAGPSSDYINHPQWEGRSDDYAVLVRYVLRDPGVKEANRWLGQARKYDHRFSRAYDRVQELYLSGRPDVKEELDLCRLYIETQFTYLQVWNRMLHARLFEKPDLREAHRRMRILIALNGGFHPPPGYSNDAVAGISQGFSQ